jgi:hypothetical protein
MAVLSMFALTVMAHAAWRGSRRRALSVALLAAGVVGIL